VTSELQFSRDSLAIDCAREVERITRTLRETAIDRFKKKGLVLGLSGGVDSSVACALCVRALGRDRVLGLLMPERESSSETHRLSRLIADHLAVPTEFCDISPILDSVGCYSSRDAAIRAVVPAYTSEHTCKIVLPSVLDDRSYRIFSVVVESPDGTITKKRLSLNAYLGVLAASNFKQRVRKMIEYYHADKLNYCVVGTPNRLEYDQGFFVKLGDGSADIKPIAHLYKSQVYQLARYLDIPEEICSRQPTTDTYSMAQSQEEFFFSLPYAEMDLCLYGKNNCVPIEQVASAADLTCQQVQAVYDDIESKRMATRYLHASPVLIDAVPEIEL
jgi:NAD+ synthase